MYRGRQWKNTSEESHTFLHWCCAVCWLFMGVVCLLASEQAKVTVSQSDFLPLAAQTQTHNSTKMSKQLLPWKVYYSTITYLIWMIDEGELVFDVFRSWKCCQKWKSFVTRTYVRTMDIWSWYSSSYVD